jgi:hypothetical protein
MRQHAQDAAQGIGHIFVLRLLGPFQKAPQFFFGDVYRVFFLAAWRNDSGKLRLREGAEVTQLETVNK